MNVITDHQGREFKYVEYAPYGEEWFSESISNPGASVGAQVLPYGYTDHLHDEETGLIYANARYLDPKTSRWLSTDPAMGDYFPLSPENKNAEEYNKNLPGLGGVFNSRNLQTYHYAGNNPIKYRDPSGGITEDGTVEKGDTLSSIAKAWGTTVEEIQKANGIDDPNKIQVGQKLARPGESLRYSSPEEAVKDFAEKYGSKDTEYGSYIYRHDNGDGTYSYYYLVPGGKYGGDDGKVNGVEPAFNGYKRPDSGDNVVGAVHNHPGGTSFSPTDKNASEVDSRKPGVVNYREYVVRKGKDGYTIEQYNPNDGKRRSDYKDGSEEQRELDAQRTSPVR